jgi:uncharacterized alpha-E superfamily protein
MMLSRVADSLYWMSRYLERAEHTARLLDVHFNILLETTETHQSEAKWGRLLASLEQEADPNMDDYALLNLLVFDIDNPQSILSSVTSARENARQIRESIPSEMWTHLNGIYLNTRRVTNETIWNSQPHEFFRQIREGSHLFQGITDSTMVRGEGWYFIQLGRAMERAISIIWLLDVQLKRVAYSPRERLSVSEYHDWLSFLKCLTAFEAYCKVYTADLRADTIAAFLLFDATFPHSLRFCVQQMGQALDAIGDSTNMPKNTKINRLIGRLVSRLTFDDMNDVLGNPHAYLEELEAQCVEIHSIIYETYIYRPVSQ